MYKGYGGKMIWEGVTEYGWKWVDMEELLLGVGITTWENT